MKLPKGLYEQLITREISEALAALDLNAIRVEQAPLDPVDSYDILARHVYSVLNRVLRALPETERLDQQVDVCNRVLKLLAERIKSATDRGSMVQPPASALLRRGIGRSRGQRPPPPPAKQAIAAGWSRKRRWNRRR